MVKVVGVFYQVKNIILVECAQNAVARLPSFFRILHLVIGKNYINIY